MDASPPNRATVVEIPLLADLILETLSHDDIWDRVLVSKSWRLVFEPHQWRHVSLVHKDGTAAFKQLSRDQQTLLFKNATRIR
jgi:hypothetical protein